MKMKRFLFLFVLCAFVLASCASAASTPAPTTLSSKAMQGFASGSNGAALSEAPSTDMTLATTSDTAASTTTSSDYSSATSTAATQQMIVKTASLNILVDDPAKSLNDIMNLVEKMGGYTVNSSRSESYGSSGAQYPTANATVRVPADKLNDALSQIEKMTGDPTKYVTNETVTGEDVTKTYTDLNSRLTNLEEADQELQKMYDKAVKAEDVLAIYNQKMQVTEQIEVIKGQMKYYQDATATSAITVQIDAKASVQPITVAGWEPKGVARDAVQALVDFLKGLANFLIWFVILIIPILLVFGIPIFFIVRGVRRRNQARRNKFNQVPPMPGEPKKE